MIAVICKNKYQFNDFLKPWVSKEDFKKFIPIRNERDLTGLMFSEYIKIGSFNEIRHLEELEYAVKARLA